MKNEIKQIQQKLEEAQKIFSELTQLQRDKCLDGFSYNYSLNHCLAQGITACDEIIGYGIIEKNPANYCIRCNKYLGFKGFCSDECYNEHYDAISEEKE